MGTANVILERARGTAFLAATMILTAVVVLLLLSAPAAGRSEDRVGELVRGPLCEPVTAVALSYTPVSVSPPATVTLRAEVITGSLPVSYTWDFGTGSTVITGTSLSGVITATRHYTATGSYPVTFTTWNTCTTPPLVTTAVVTVTAPPCVPPSGIVVTHTPTVVYTDTPVLFTGEITTGTLPVTYTWRFETGTEPLVGTASAHVLTATHTFSMPATYTPALTVESRCTITPVVAYDTVQVTVCRPISDVTVAYVPGTPRAGQLITFSAATIEGSHPVQYEWAFGDGYRATGPVVTHSYTTPATYTLALTAANHCSGRTITTSVPIARWRVYVPVVFGRDTTIAPPLGIGLGYGASLAACDHTSYLAEMGFDWGMGFVRWVDAGAGPVYDWRAVDDQLGELLPGVHHVLLRLHHPTPTGIADPPVSGADLVAFRAFAQALAEYVDARWRTRGLETIAYEVWNEPNLGSEWGTPPTQPSAAQYAALLRAGYAGIKAGDPAAIVVSAGLTSTGDGLYDTPAERTTAMARARAFYGTDQVVSDLTFLRNMYLNGAMGFFDAVGTHPYGGRDAPDTPPDDATAPLYFRRAEEQREVMLSFGDRSPMWVTEFGWILESHCDVGPFEWMEVSEAEQAAYLAEAYSYAWQEWPWMGPMFVFNLDFATVPYYDLCDPMRWFSLIYRDEPTASGPILTRLAFSTLRDMEKHSSW